METQLQPIIIPTCTDPMVRTHQGGDECSSAHAYLFPASRILSFQGYMDLNSGRTSRLDCRLVFSGYTVFCIICSHIVLYRLHDLTCYPSSSLWLGSVYDDTRWFLPRPCCVTLFTFNHVSLLSPRHALHVFKQVFNFNCTISSVTVCDQ